MKDLKTLYDSRAGDRTADFPYGSIKDATTPLTGTPYKQEWQNDWLAFFQKMMVEAGVTPNDNTDTVQSSQLFEALESVITSRSKALSLGFNWMPVTVGDDSESWRAGAYGAGKYVVVSTTGSGHNHFAYSTDGLNWTQGTITEFEALASGQQLYIQFDGTNFVILNPIGTDALLSTDGINWTAQALVIDGASGSLASPNFIYGGGQFVAESGGTTARLLTSPDGYTWTTRTTITNGPFGGLTYDSSSGNYVAVRSGTADNNERVYTSPDGIIWTARNSADDTTSWSDVTATNGYLSAVSFDGTGQRSMWSDDGGLTWTMARTAGDSFGWYAVDAVDNLIMSCASTPREAIMISRDGRSWSATYNSLEDMTNSSITSIFGANGIAIGCSVGKLYVSGV